MSYFWLLVINQIVSASLLALVAIVCGRFIKNATIMHLLWGAVFAKLLIPSPIVIPIPVVDSVATQFILAVDPEPLIPATIDNVEPSVAVADVHQTGSQVSHLSEFPKWQFSLGMILLAIWFAGSALLFARGLWRYHLLQSLLRNESVADNDANRLAESIVTLASFVKRRHRQLPVVRLFAARISPMLFGIGRQSTIVCPKSLWDSLSDTERKAFLGHELSHYFRRDHWVRWLEWLATVIYWWFPLVYISRNRLERYEEIACDSWTVNHFPIGRREYASALLNVVDFLNESSVGVPRLASRMQATQNLEERLQRLLIKESAPNPDRRRTLAIVGSLVVACPTFLVTRIPADRSDIVVALPTSELGIPELPLATELNPKLSDSQASLPERPNGWWNESPIRRWADFRLKRDDFQLLADAGKGVRIVHADHSYYQFETGYIRSLCYIATSGRFVIGNSDGEIHLWDPDLNRSVSLIGKTNSPVTSISFHPEHGLATSDVSGDIRIWELGSGQITSFLHMKRGVAALRWSSNGKSLYVVEGDWASGAGNCELVSVSPNLETELSRAVLPNSVALVQTDERYGPLALDWTGRVWSLITNDVVGFVNKEQVSGATLCENVFGVLIDKLFAEAVER